ncbi:peptidylprolyl isomerase fpr3 [Coemansia spiralis]|nr:peptidylprolyl isomerase fpr3 [Coemansia spiralis]
MLRGFWGLKIEPGKTYSQTVDASFRVSNAALGVKPASAARTSVLLTIDEKSFVLCSLTPDEVEQHLLDITITEGEEITFETQGDNEVHLTGNFIDDAPDSSDSEDSDDDLDLSNISPEELQEMIEQGLIDPEMLLGGDDDEDDSDYDSDDAEADDRIREITDEEEAELVQEAEAEKAEPVKEVKIKKQAEKTNKADKKRKALEEAAVAAAAADEAATEAKKAKKAAVEEKKAKAEPAKELAGGVKAEIVKEGAGAGVKKGARVGMYYIGKLTNGKVFDKNTKGKPFWFRLGAGEVIKGWDVGIVGMKKGGERRLTIPAAMAYGKRGAPPDIPPNATLVFDIRLVEFK